MYATHMLSADMLYEDKSASSEFAEISYIVTDPDGEMFVERVMPDAGTYTFTVMVRAVTEEQTYTQQKTVDVTVEEIRPVSAEIAEMPAKNSFQYRTSPDFSGLAVRILYNDGHEEIETNPSNMTVRPDSSARVRRGSQTFRVTTRGVSATFTMQARLTWWQWLILILLFGWIWY